MMKRVLILMVIFGGTLNGQLLELDPCAKFQNRERKVIPYTHLREADAMWSKRVWSIIDLREKMNHHLYYPLEPICSRRSLSWTIRTFCLEGTITAYDALDDEFRIPLTISEVEAIGSGWDTISVEDPETGEMTPTPVFNEFDYSTVKRVRLKED